MPSTSDLVEVIHLYFLQTNMLLLLRYRWFDLNKGSLHVQFQSLMRFVPIDLLKSELCLSRTNVTLLKINYIFKSVTMSRLSKIFQVQIASDCKVGQ